MEHQKAIVDALRSAQKELTRVKLGMLLYAVQSFCQIIRKEMEV
jgi:hypothetical protein